jgi:hypothetical protein
MWPFFGPKLMWCLKAAPYKLLISRIECRILALFLFSFFSHMVLHNVIFDLTTLIVIFIFLFFLFFFEVPK